MICASAAALIAGIAMRDKVDVGRISPKSPNRVYGSGLLTSRTNQAEIPEAKYFSELSQLLKQRYVEPIKDDLKLASGGVRGMIASLNDVQSLFFTPELAKAYASAIYGKYEGIGADLVLERKGSASPSSVSSGEAPEDPFAPSQLPRVVIAGVVPGGPADRAGAKAGDWVESVDGHWVYSAEAIDELRTAQRKVEAKEWPPARLRELSLKLRAKANGAIMPFKAFDMLARGTTGTLKVVFNRPGGTQQSTQMTKSLTEIAPVKELSPGVFNLRLTKGVGARLEMAMGHTPEITLDLRSQAYGDFDAFREALGALAKPGTYGSLAHEGGRPGEEIRLQRGNPNPPKIRVLVDGNTGGIYQAFALALANGSGAKIEGTMNGSPLVSKFKALPDGSAYTLTIGKYDAKSEVAR